MGLIYSHYAFYFVISLEQWRKSWGGEVLVYTQEGSLWSIVLRCDDHTGILRAIVPPETRTFMCPPRHRAMWLNFLAQGKSLPPAGIEFGIFGLQRSRVSHVIHCARLRHSKYISMGGRKKIVCVIIATEIFVQNPWFWLILRWAPFGAYIVLIGVLRGGGARGPCPPPLKIG